MKKESVHSLLEKKILRSNKDKISIDSLDFGIKVDDEELLKDIPTEPAIKIIENGITNFIRKRKYSNGYGKMQDYLCFGVNSKNLGSNYFTGINKSNFPNAVNYMQMLCKNSQMEILARNKKLMTTFTNIENDSEIIDNLRVNSLDIKIDIPIEEDIWFPDMQLDVKSKFREDYEDYKTGCKIQNRRGAYSDNKSNKSTLNLYDKIKEMNRDLIKEYNQPDFYSCYLKNEYVPRNLKRIELTLIDTASYIKFGLLLPGQKNKLTNIFDNIDKFGKDILIKALDYYLIHGGENIVYEELSKVEKNVFNYLNQIVKSGDSIEDRKGFDKFASDFLTAKNPNKNIISSYRKALRRIYHLYFPRVKFELKTKK